MATTTMPEMRSAAGLPPALSPVLDEVDAMDAQAEADEQLAGGFPRTALEAAAGVESLDALLYQQRRVTRELAPLEAIFGGSDNAFADARRKQHRQYTASRILGELQAAHAARVVSEQLTGKEAVFKAPSEAELERLANSDQAHITWCDHLEQQRAQWSRLRTQLAEVKARLDNREVELNAYVATQGAR